MYSNNKPIDSGQLTLDECLEIQETEIEVMKTIYMDDFKDVTLDEKSPWDVKPLHQFLITLRSVEKDPMECKVTLKFKLPAAYPKAKPVVNILNLQNITESQKENMVLSLNKIMNDAVHRNEQILFELTSFIQERIDQLQTETHNKSLEDQLFYASAPLFCFAKIHCYSLCLLNRSQDASEKLWEKLHLAVAVGVTRKQALVFFFLLSQRYRWWLMSHCADMVAEN